MNASDLRPARDFAQQFGAKCIIYGPPGSAKTPIINTAPRPVLLATEPGLLSMRNSNVPTWIAPNKARIDEFFKWYENSSEAAKNFDTLAIDSTSQMCDIALSESKAKHGLAQYGEMADYVYPYLERLYFRQNAHMYLIAKEEFANGVKRPFYPGQYLPKQIPHKYDCVLRLARVPIPMYGEQLAFQCNGSIDIIARNRTGTLNDFEPPDFSAIVRKVMQ